MTSIATGQVERRSTGVVAVGVAGAAIVAVAVNAAVAAVAHAAGASDEFGPLQLPAFAGLTVVGLLIAVAGWAIVRARAARPRWLLNWLVPVVLVLSWIPDLLLGASGSMPGTGWGAVAALMVMHAVVAAVVVAACRWLLPLPVRD